MDTLISNVTVVTMNEKMDVLFGAFLGIKVLRILAVNIGFNIFAFYNLGLALFSFILFLTA